MQAAVMDSVRTEPATFDLPDPQDVLYPEFQFPTSREPGSALSTAFVVDSAAKADWAIGRILSLEARMARRVELAIELHNRIDAWLAKAQAPDTDSVTYLTSLLRPYVEAELANQHRSRTLTLPSGSASLRRLPERVDITDREAALAWCEAHAPEVVVIKKDLSKTELKRLVLKASEPVPGVDATLGVDTLIIKASA